MNLKTILPPKKVDLNNILNAEDLKMRIVHRADSNPYRDGRTGEPLGAVFVRVDGKLKGRRIFHEKCVGTYRFGASYAEKDKARERYFQLRATAKEFICAFEYACKSEEKSYRVEF